MTSIIADVAEDTFDGLVNLPSVVSNAGKLEEAQELLVTMQQNLEVLPNHASDLKLAELMKYSGENSGPRDAQGVSIFQRIYKDVLDPKQKWPPELVAYAKRLREVTGDKKLAQCKLVIEAAGIRGDDPQAFREMQEILKKMTPGVDNADSFPPDVEELFNGKLKQPLGARSRGPWGEESTVECQNCSLLGTGAASLLGAYSRYLSQGERAALNLIDAASFVAGQRRRSPRSQRQGVHEQELYSAGCAHSDGTSSNVPFFRRFNLSRATGRKFLQRFVNGSLSEQGIIRTSGRRVSDYLKGRLAPEEVGLVDNSWGSMDKNIYRLDMDAVPNLDTPPKTIGLRRIYPDGPGGRPRFQEFRPRNGGPVNFEDGAGVGNDPSDLSSNGVPNQSFASEVEGMLAGEAKTNVSDAEFEQLRLRGGYGTGTLGPRLSQYGDEAAAMARSGEKTANPIMNWIKKYMLANFGKMLFVGAQGFLAFDVFEQMAHDRSGCILQHVRKDDTVISKRKICQNSTWHKNLLQYWPRDAIESNCTCKYVDAAAGVQVPPDHPPKALKAAGCEDLGDPTKRPCRSLNEKGFNYTFTNVSPLQAMMDTALSFAKDLKGCVECSAKLAGLIFSGGIGSVFGIVLVLIVLYIVKCFWRTFAVTS